jgi:hypothetical protein
MTSNHKMQTIYRDLSTTSEFSEEFKKIRFIPPASCEKAYGASTRYEFNETGTEYLPRYIENHKAFCLQVNELQDADLTCFDNILKMRGCLEQSKTLFTELNGERLRLENELKRVNICNPEFDEFPSRNLINDVEYEAFHNTQVITMSRFMVYRDITEIKLKEINMYLGMVKLKIQKMAVANHGIMMLINSTP